MNWKRINLKHISLWIGVMVMAVACDAFEEDVVPIGDEVLGMKADVAVLPGSPYYLDLKENLKASEPAKFQIATPPISGTASILPDAILKYVPEANFMNGLDSLSVDLINEKGSVIAKSGVVIRMVSSSDSIPCFNGALSDYYAIYSNEVFVFNPLDNDGFCAEEVSQVTISFCEQPKHGILTSLSSQQYHFAYSPTPDFTGSDSFMYSLVLTDKEGNEFHSTAEINFEILGIGSDQCDSVIYPFFYEFYQPAADHYIFEPFRSHPSCDISEWEVTILSVEQGTAEVTEEGLIKYFPSEEIDSADNIYYQLHFLDKTVENVIHIMFLDVEDDTCTIAVDDEYLLYFVPDSMGWANEPYYLQPADNDKLCDEFFELEILTQPNIGVVSVSADQRLEYYIEEEFSGQQETSLEYEICNQGKCDNAWIFLTLDQ